MVSPKDPEGVELVLHVVDAPARAFQQPAASSAGPVLNVRRR